MGTLIPQLVLLVQFINMRYVFYSVGSLWLWISTGQKTLMDIEIAPEVNGKS
jgi:hypothetical protein